MSKFKKLSDKEIAALTPEEKTRYENALSIANAQEEARAKANDEAKDQAEKEAKEKAEEEKKAKEEAAATKKAAKEEEKESKTTKGWETSDGYQFPVKNDAENYARTLPEGEREIEECTIKA